MKVLLNWWKKNCAAYILYWIKIALSIIVAILLIKIFILIIIAWCFIWVFIPNKYIPIR